MPELPEVETTLRGIKPYLKNATISDIIVRNASLRWPVPIEQLRTLVGQKIVSAERRAKYILIHAELGSILLHLGMSGSIRILEKGSAVGKHDHIDIDLNEATTIRFNDPRRFGCCLLVHQPINKHKLIANLGPEPLTRDFDGDVLFMRSRGRAIAVKSLIMDGSVVVGVGNIYACESLFLAGIRPTMASKRLSRKRYAKLADTIKLVLMNAIKAGGTTLNDFSQTDGKPGYFAQKLRVYGRAGEACDDCGTLIKSQFIGQRNTFYCANCQHF